ncbi:MAG: hypothetical protein U9R64_15140 [Pseudomonadota bacterium]|nr:hypothetical protein [Pseudomonadota bacterium]
MADRPMLFSSPMVCALLEGRKAQTRRVLKLPGWAAKPPEFEEGEQGVAAICAETGCFALLPTPQIGDRLWVKETWRVSPEACEGWNPDDARPTGWIDYRARGSEERSAPNFDAVCRATFGKSGEIDWDCVPSDWRPSIFMPRWASRLTLNVTNVRVQRLNDCSEEDAIAEGIEARGVGCLWGWIDYLETNPNVTRHFADPRRSYASLWDHINGPGAWEANPWVVALSFDVRKGNIDG